ncbi:MAG: dihydropteroate synthase [Proteobacteria bacterium]|nr:dihydropteroate synthase [Pseudomonadota bacterium]
MALATLELKNCRFDWSRPYIAGVVNVTPDSFSDGGRYLSIEDAVARGRDLVEAGADLIDVGGESTRPGANAVDAHTEIERVVPVIRTLARSLDVPISVDTTKADVARAAVEAGAEIVNDISGGLFDPEIVNVTEHTGSVYICGHVRGAAIAEVHAGESDPPDFRAVAFELARRIASLPISLRHRTIVDPGLGFGKKTAQNIELVRYAGELGRSVGCPVMVGPSRKRFIRELTRSGSPSSSRPDVAARVSAQPMNVLDTGTIGACLAAVGSGANILRVHNVELLKPALMVYQAIVDSTS